MMPEPEAFKTLVREGFDERASVFALQRTVNSLSKSRKLLSTRLLPLFPTIMAPVGMDVSRGRNRKTEKTRRRDGKTSQGKKEGDKQKGALSVSSTGNKRDRKMSDQTLSPSQIPQQQQQHSLLSLRGFFGKLEGWRTDRPWVIVAFRRSTDRKRVRYSVMSSPMALSVVAAATHARRTGQPVDLAALAMGLGSDGSSSSVSTRGGVSEGGSVATDASGASAGSYLFFFFFSFRCVLFCFDSRLTQDFQTHHELPLPSLSH